MFDVDQVNAIKPISSGGVSSAVAGSTGGWAVVLACAAVTEYTASVAMVSTMWRASIDSQRGVAADLGAVEP